jgi:hypothetical protein
VALASPPVVPPGTEESRSSTCTRWRGSSLSSQAIFGLAQIGQDRAVAVAIAMSTASWCSRLNAPSPDRQVAHTQSRRSLGTRYQSRRHIRRDGSIDAAQPGTEQWLASGGTGGCGRPGPHPGPVTNASPGAALVYSAVHGGPPPPLP